MPNHQSGNSLKTSKSCINRLDNSPIPGTKPGNGFLAKKKYRAIDAFSVGGQVVELCPTTVL